MKDVLTLRDRIQRERVKNILSREDLGNLSGVDPIDIMRIEKGFEDISLNNLIKIVNAIPTVGSKLRILKSVGFDL